MPKRKSSSRSKKQNKTNNAPLWIILILIICGTGYAVFLMSHNDAVKEKIKVVMTPEKAPSVSKKETLKREKKAEVSKKKEQPKEIKNDKNTEIAKALDAFDKSVNELRDKAESIKSNTDEKKDETLKKTKTEIDNKETENVKRMEKSFTGTEANTTKIPLIEPDTPAKSDKKSTEKPKRNLDEQKETTEAIKDKKIISEAPKVSEVPKDKVELISVKPITKPSRSAFGGKEISGVSSKNKIALTFDAGSSPAPTGSILKTLREKNVTATFFLTGEWMRKNPELTRQIIASGNEIGNHSFHHPDFKKLSKEQIVKELDDTNAMLNKTAGINCAPYFRAPYGSRNQDIINIVASKGYTHIYWAVDSWDSVRKDITASEIYSRVTTLGTAGDIVLLHCGSSATAAALPKIIDKFKSEGITPSTISSLL